MDVKNAFLQGELEYEVYMHPPSGLESMVKPGNVLSQGMYHKLSTTLNGRGFRKSELDHTLFTLITPSGIICLLVYVDDTIITGSDKVGIQETKDYLTAVFEIKDLGEMNYFLGIEICRTKIHVPKEKYT